MSARRRGRNRRLILTVLFATSSLPVLAAPPTVPPGASEPSPVASSGDEIEDLRRAIEELQEEVSRLKETGTETEKTAERVGGIWRSRSTS